MRLTALALIAAIGSAGALAGCADNYVSGPPGAYADVDYSVYYDGYYGPFADGYWGAQGYFYYRDGQGYRRDGAHHFRHDSASGYHPIQGHAPPAHGSGAGSGHHGRP